MSASLSARDSVELAALNRLGTTSFSWEGEDVVAAKILRDRYGVQTGFYVDVGAYDSIVYSNTFLFYQRGWRGINIDARPGSMEHFRRIRPEDTNLEIGIAGEAATQTYIQFEEPALNGFLNDRDVKAHERRGAKVIARCSVPCFPLATILDRYQVPADFDLLTVDVEGLDLEVLLSVDFKRYRPKLIVAEVLGCHDVIAALESPMARAMNEHGYKLFSKLDFSVMFVDEAHC